MGQAGKRLGLVRAFLPRLNGHLRLAWPPRGPRTTARPGQMEHDTEPEQSEERELREKQRRNHGIAPLHGGVMGELYRVLRRKQLSAAGRYTAVHDVNPTSTPHAGWLLAPGRCFPRSGLWRATPTLHRLSQTMHTALREAGLMDELSHALFSVVTKIRVNEQASVPKSHVGLFSEG